MNTQTITVVVKGRTTDMVVLNTIPATTELSAQDMAKRGWLPLNIIAQAGRKNGKVHMVHQSAKDGRYHSIIAM
jgi:hypothetical protein